ncbi:hypothetical protein DFH28DRAFT_1087318 [Melampsora americana]|nr:hypothetical protein DFH28DRAFT_1087318 [Melampsora americana]
MSLPVIMNAILPALTNAVRVGGDDFMPWYLTPTTIVMLDNHLERVMALGHVTPPERLFGGMTYHLSGPLGQDPNTGQAMVRHASDTQSQVPPPGPTQQALAGKAMVSGIGKVMNVQFDEVVNHGGSWNLTLNVQHDYYDRLQEKRFEFVITYCFGYLTPEIYEWKHIIPGVNMWLHGHVVYKDPVTKCFIVQVRLSDLPWMQP